MKNTGLSTMKKLGKFVSEAFLLRKSLLNNTWSSWKYIDVKRADPD